MRGAVVLLLFAGCDALFRLSHVEPPVASDAGDGDSQDGRPCTQDSFDGGNTQLVMRWNRDADSATCSVNAVNDELVVAIDPNSACYAQIEEITTHSFVNTRVTVRVPQLLASPSVQTYLEIEKDRDNYYHFDADYGDLVMRAEVLNADIESESIPYDDVAHLWWRIEYVQQTNKFDMSTSPDGQNFIVRFSLNAWLGTENLRVVIGAGTYDTSNAAPGIARFDDFELCTR